MKPAIIMLVSLFICKMAGAQTISIADNKDPALFVDSVRTSMTELPNIKPDDIASINVIKDTRRLLPGDENGVIYIETKKFVTARFQRFLASRSKKYADLLSSATVDTEIQYILNGNPLNRNFLQLAAINSKNFKSVKIISARHLKRKYNVTGKKTGVVIETKHLDVNPVAIALR